MDEPYARIAPRVDDRAVLVAGLTGLLRLDDDLADEARCLPMPILVVAGDACRRATRSSASSSLAAGYATRAGTDQG